MNLDVLGGVVTGLIALALFTVFHYSSPARPSWFSFPFYFRAALWASGASLMVRSVNLFTIREPDVQPLGHINPEGMVTSLCLLALAASGVVMFLRHRLDDKGWDRLSFMERLMRRDHSMRPVPMTTREVVATTKAMGFTVKGPGE